MGVFGKGERFGWEVIVGGRIPRTRHSASLPDATSVGTRVELLESLENYAALASSGITVMAAYSAALAARARRMS